MAMTGYGHPVAGRAPGLRSLLLNEEEMGTGLSVSVRDNGSDSGRNEVDAGLSHPEVDRG